MPSKEPAFSVGEDKSPTTEARPEQPVLGFQLFDERFLLPGEPCSEHNDQRAASAAVLDARWQRTSGRRIMG